jgi:hypothetical protein
MGSGRTTVPGIRLRPATRRAVGEPAPPTCGPPAVLAGLARGSLRSKTARLTEALTGRFTDHHAFLLTQMLQRVDAATADIATVQARIEAQIGQLAPAVARLDAIPGVGPVAAQMILAEIGTDMGRFPTPGHLASWARFAPGVNESAGRPKGKAGTGNGIRYLARIFGEAAVSAARTDTFLGERYRRIARRRGRKRAIVAISRSILVIIWALLSDTEAQFVDLGPDYYASRPTPSAGSASTFANCRPLATRSPSTPRHDQGSRDFRISRPQCLAPSRAGGGGGGRGGECRYLRGVSRPIRRGSRRPGGRRAARGRRR